MKHRRSWGRAGRDRYEFIRGGAGTISQLPSFGALIVASLARSPPGNPVNASASRPATWASLRRIVEGPGARSDLRAMPEEVLERKVDAVTPVELAMSSPLEDVIGEIDAFHEARAHEPRSA